MTDAEHDLILRHFARHAAENGADGFWFMVPGVQASIDRDLVQAPLSEPGWQRLWTTEIAGDVVAHAQVIGNAVSPHRCTLSMGVEAGFRGQGLGRKLMHQAVSWCVAQPELAWIDGWALAHNKPVLKLDYSVGFFEVGLVEDALRVDGESYDQVILALRLR